MLETTTETTIDPAVVAPTGGGKNFLYEIRLDPRKPMVKGEVIARDLDDAKRRLRVKYARAKLPVATNIVEKLKFEQQAERAKSAKLRLVLRTLADHHAWLKDLTQGRRADLSGLNLAGMKLPKTDLRLADLAGADLSGADLSKAQLGGVNLVRASLKDANLSGADFSDADLSETDLRGAILTGAKLHNTDLWRANLMDCTISPKLLHEALRCKKA